MFWEGKLPTFGWLYSAWTVDFQYYYYQPDLFHTVHRGTKFYVYLMECALGTNIPRYTI
jgi:hypothetical protein